MTKQTLFSVKTIQRRMKVSKLKCFTQISSQYFDALKKNTMWKEFENLLVELRMGPSLGTVQHNRLVEGDRHSVT